MFCSMNGLASQAIQWGFDMVGHERGHLVGASGGPAQLEDWRWKAKVSLREPCCLQTAYTGTFNGPF